MFKFSVSIFCCDNAVTVTTLVRFRHEKQAARVQKTNISVVCRKTQCWCFIVVARLVELPPFVHVSAWQRFVTFSSLVTINNFPQKSFFFFFFINPWHKPVWWRPDWNPEDLLTRTWLKQLTPVTPLNDLKKFHITFTNKWMLDNFKE